MSAGCSAQKRCMSILVTERIAIGASPCGGPVGTANWEDKFWVARFGLSYKFGVREPIVPLK